MLKNKKNISHRHIKFTRKITEMNEVTFFGNTKVLIHVLIRMQEYVFKINTIILMS